jgi:GT2 family glycosyltransferase
MNKVNCVVVTYNRLDLLKECVNALINQSYRLNKIIIVNNASSDGTKEYLFSLPHSQFENINLEKNIGGAGGFNIGLKKSLQLGADWTWLMDDDTIPFSNALEQLVTKTVLDTNIGFLCSNVLWTDNSFHKMNIPHPEKIMNNIPFYYYFEHGVILVNYSSFVSCLINQNAIRSLGFPIKEFFIWLDDIEYTKRITKSNYLGLFVPESKVIHKTFDNYGPSMIDAKPNVFGKFYFSQRNEIYCIKKDSNFIKFLYYFCKLTVKSISESLKNKNGKFQLLSIVLRGRFAGLFFNPKIEKYE